MAPFKKQSSFEAAGARFRREIPCSKTFVYKQSEDNVRRSKNGFEVKEQVLGQLFFSQISGNRRQRLVGNDNPYKTKSLMSLINLNSEKNCKL